jgi:hypothetical protein
VVTGVTVCAAGSEVPATDGTTSAWVNGVSVP